MTKIVLPNTKGAENTNNPAIDFLAMESNVNRPAFLIRRTTDMTVPANAVNTIVSFETASYDADSMWNSGDPTIAYVRTAGLWLVGANASTNLGTGGQGFTISVYGGTDAVQTKVSVPSNINQVVVATSSMMVLNIGDQITCKVMYDHATLTIDVTEVKLWGTLIAPT